MGPQLMSATEGVPEPSFWRGRRVLVTGHTGFKGSWLTAWLQTMGAEVCGVSLPKPPSRPCLWDQLELKLSLEVRADVATYDWHQAVVGFSPEVVLHLAAQSLVPAGYADPARTFETNVMGTVRTLELLERLEELRSTIIVTTDKVYSTKQQSPFSEGSFLGGADPYSASKACAELVTQSWPASAQPVATARAGNVIGGGDWSADRLVPDLVRSWGKAEVATLRRPDASRPWQHVLEPLRGYLLYAEALATGVDVSLSLNFGPTTGDIVTVRQVVEHAAVLWAARHGRTPEWSSLPSPPIHETDQLQLTSQRAADELGWRSALPWKKTLDLTIEWYSLVRSGTAAMDVVHRQLADYTDYLMDAEAPHVR